MHAEFNFNISFMKILNIKIPRGKGGKLVIVGMGTIRPYDQRRHERNHGIGGINYSLTISVYVLIGILMRYL